MLPESSEMVDVNSENTQSGSPLNVIALGAFVRDQGQYIVWVIMTLYLNDIRSVGYVVIGLIFLIGGLIGVPVSIYGGNLMDKIGRRKFAVIMPWINLVIYTLIFGVIQFSYPTYLVEILFISIGPVSSLQFIAIEAIVTDVSIPEKRANAMGTLRIASNLGIGVGLVAGGYISDYSYSFVFILPILGSLIEGMLYYLKIPETMPDSELIEPGDNKLHILEAFKDHLFISIALTLEFAWFITGMFETPLTPLYFTSHGHYTNFMVTTLFAVNTLTVITMQTPITRFFAGHKDTTAIVFGLVLFAAGFYILYSTLNYYLLVLGVFVLTLGENANAPASFAMISKLAPRDRRGTFLGSFSAISSVIGPFKPLVATTLLALLVYAPERVWLLLSAGSLSLAVFFFFVFRAANRKIEKRSAN